MQDKGRLIKAVIERLNLNKYEAEKLCERIEVLHEDLDEVINMWIAAGEISPYSVEGITIQDIMTKEKCNFIRALFSMSVLIKNPQLAARYNELKFDLED
jgi:hypothetical protein